MTCSLVACDRCDKDKMNSFIFPSHIRPIHTLYTRSNTKAYILMIQTFLFLFVIFDPFLNFLFLHNILSCMKLKY